MDKLVKNVTSADESFVFTYKNTRNIIDPAFKKKKKAEAASLNISGTTSVGKDSKKDSMQKVA